MYNNFKYIYNFSCILIYFYYAIVFYKSIQYDVSRGNASEHSVASVRVTLQHCLGYVLNINERQQKNLRRVSTKTVTR